MSNILLIEYTKPQEPAKAVEPDLRIVVHPCRKCAGDMRVPPNSEVKTMYPPLYLFKCEGCGHSEYRHLDHVGRDLQGLRYRLAHQAELMRHNIKLEIDETEGVTVPARCFVNGQKCSESEMLALVGAMGIDPKDIPRRRTK